MSTDFLELSNEQLNRALQECLIPKLKKAIASRERGHCMRVADLDLKLASELSKVLRREIPNAQVYILNNGQNSSEEDIYISSTKLVELRNPLQDGSLRPPLLIFLPSNLHTNAEDSFNVASFEDIAVTDVYEQLIKNLIQRLPSPLQGYVKNGILAFLASEKWTWADAVSQARFLLTAIHNGNDGDTLGAALYELGLVPDFHLFDDPSLTSGKIRKNLDCVKKLTYSDLSIRGRIIDLGLSEHTVRNRLTQLLIEKGIETPKKWTSQIVLKQSNWDLSFDKWKFLENINLAQISIEVLETDLPKVPEDVTEEKLQSLVGTQILNPEDRAKLQVQFAVEPQPSQIQGLSYFTVQIISRDAGAVGNIKKVKVWKTKAQTKKVSLDKLNKFELEEGWHCIRVLAWTEEGISIPLCEPQKKKNESDLFYVIAGETIDDDPQQDSIPKENSLEHGKIALQFTAINERQDPQKIISKNIVWSNKNSRNRQVAQETLEIQFDRAGKRQIPVATELKNLEQNILRSPQQLCYRQWLIQRGKSESIQEKPIEWFNLLSLEHFLAARAKYFAAVSQGEKELISQATDFFTLKEIGLEYAQTYRDVLIDLRCQIERDGGNNYQSLRDLKNLLAIDTVQILVTDFRGQTKEALLVGPTHPLRALWLVTWAAIAQHWLKAAQNGSQEYISSVREGLLEGLAPLNIPAAFPLSDGRIFVAIDNIHPFWSLYAPTTEADPRGLLGEICTALGVSEPSSNGTAITAKVLANRIERYLVQHPYISTLKIDVFNAGRGTLLADALTILQQRPNLELLRYDINLFVSDPDAPGVGEALEDLLSSSNASNTDDFSTPSGNHLFPKLNLAVRSIESFRQYPMSYQAHLGISLDLFPAKDIGSAAPFSIRETTPLHGLIQDFTIQFQDNEKGTLWKRQPRHGKVSNLPGLESWNQLLAQLPELMSGAIATVATGAPSFNNRPTFVLGLEAQERQLMYYIHQACDWVFTIDRNIGIEFFDRGTHKERPAYLVDYVPHPTASFGHRLAITSRSLSELESILSKILAKYGLKAEGDRVALVLEQLRSLSGRLALKLLSSSQQQTEVLGLALARLFLEYQGALSNQIIVPLDAHLDLFRTAQQKADELGETVSLQRTDLALFDLNATNRTISCNLVEVKCYTNVGSVSNFNRLKEEIAEQIDRSEKVLRQHFEYLDRPDLLFKTREFATLLDFYLDRSLRYRLINKEAAQEAKIFLATLEDDYTLQFTRSGLIFDFEKAGTEPPDNERGVEYHRIGIDLIEALVALAKPASDSTETSISAIAPEQEDKTTYDSIPRLTSAAFIVPERERSTTWEEETLNREQQSTISPPKNAIPSSEFEVTKNEFSASEQQNNQNLSEIVIAQSEENVILPAAPDEEAEEIGQPKLAYDILLGDRSSSPQYGLLGEVAGRKVALDLNQTHTISLFGVQGAGKSYTLGSIVEMACLPIANINSLPSPLATVIFHYSPTQDYKPEFTSMVNPNSEATQLKLLRERYGAEPTALQDVIILTPASKVDSRKIEYPDIEVLPITFAASELKVSHWKFLMGAIGNRSIYIQQINTIMKKLRNSLTLAGIREARVSARKMKL
jgi:DNA phosphorothioation-dependent restriction protein DptH